MADIADIADDLISSRLQYELERLNADRPTGPGLIECEDCGEEIQQARRAALPGVRLCVECQSAAERRGGSMSIRDSWRTPPEIFAAMNREYRFVADVACCDSNALCSKGITESQDALTTPWRTVAQPGEYVWCNPPYSNILPWVEAASRAQADGVGTVMLVMSDTSTQWFRKAIAKCQMVIFITAGRVAFIDPVNGITKSGNNKGSLLFVWDPYGKRECVFSSVTRDELMAAGRKVLKGAA